MKIAIGSDHAGFKHKEVIVAYLRSKGHEVIDFGTNSNESCDYPTYIKPTAKAVASGDCDKGIVLGGSGNGEQISANKVKGIRCALCWNLDTAKLAAQHNDANMISIGERQTTQEDALHIVDTWLSAAFEGGRHLRRINQLEIDLD
jgi:ribose 5-phosphate isomerase B|tara:strand:- start:894 stop:1331 length:438 start_codon:yes stop_codon:yes gene_type:complete